MPLIQGEDGDREFYDALYRAMQTPVRRRILFQLLDTNPQQALVVPEDVHVGGTDPDELIIALVHRHLPILSEAGLIRWDREANEVHNGPNYANISELIEAVMDKDRKYSSE